MQKKGDQPASRTLRDILNSLSEDEKKKLAKALKIRGSEIVAHDIKSLPQIGGGERFTYKDRLPFDDETVFQFSDKAYSCFMR